MSYARRTDGNSDVYVFRSGGLVHCCHCSISNDFAGTPAEMLRHLAEHQLAGQLVPRVAIEWLASEASPVFVEV